MSTWAKPNTTHVKEREIIVHCRGNFIGGKSLHESEMIVPDNGSGVLGSRLAVTVSAAGHLARRLSVAGETSQSHAFVRVTSVDGSSWELPCRLL